MLYIDHLILSPKQPWKVNTHSRHQMLICINEMSEYPSQFYVEELRFRDFWKLPWDHTASKNSNHGPTKNLSSLSVCCTALLVEEHELSFRMVLPDCPERDKEPLTVWTTQLIALNRWLTLLKRGLPVQLSVLKEYLWLNTLGFFPCHQSLKVGETLPKPLNYLKSISAHLPHIYTRGSANIFCKGPDCEYFWLCRPYGFCCNYSTLPL